jgi:[acyl-carrier-protein] S-malonyltransferase
MGRGFFEADESARGLLQSLSTASGIDLKATFFSFDEDTLRQTENAQPALYSAGLLALHALRAVLKLSPSGVAGHSVGEYAALAAAGVLTAEDGARLVAVRGRLMAEAGRSRPGTMAAVIGADDSLVETVCSEASKPEAEVVVANYNSPGQVVISGDTAGVDEAARLLSEKGVKRVIRLNVSGAFHSPLMTDSAQRLAESLRETQFLKPGIPIWSNVTGQIEPDPLSWPGLLQRQLASAVRWSQGVKSMVESGIELFIECGPGEVLCGLIRRIAPEVKAVPLREPSDLEAVVEAVG